MKKVLVTLMAAIFLLACYVPVYAVDWDMYGSARVQTFWTDYDEDHSFGDADTTQLSHTLLGNSRIGATVDHGPIGGAFEYGASGGNANIRILSATLDFGPGELLIGQNYVPFSLGSYISGQVYAADANMGEFYADMARRPMVQYTVSNFSFALVEPEARGIYDIDGADSAYGGQSNELQIPQFQARYHNTLAEGLGFNIAGLYQTYDLNNEDEAWDGESVDSWGVNANLQFSQLDPVYFNVGGLYGENLNDAGAFYPTRIFSVAQFNADGDGIENTETYAGLLVAGTSVGGIGLEAGAGYLNSDNDTWEDEIALMAYYAHAKIPMLENVNAYIIPEIGFYEWDAGDADEEDFDELYAGVQWRMDF